MKIYLIFLGNLVILGMGKMRGTIRFFQVQRILSSSGKQGTISLQNNEGLHCGPIFEGERLISWIRYGCSGGVDTRTINKEQIKLNQNLKEILKEEEYGFLIKELFY